MSCYCLCVVNHPDHPGICTGEARSMLRFSGFPADSILSKVGYVEVQVCDPCRQSTVAEKSDTGKA